MTLKINKEPCSYNLTNQFVEILTKETGHTMKNPTRAITLNFRDPSYSAATGGFHPVEIRINSNVEIEYITDFCYVGQPPFSELTKELDFDFLNQCFFQLFKGEYPIDAGAELFEIWQTNFVSYVSMSVFEITVTFDS